MNVSVCQDARSNDVIPRHRLELPAMINSMSDSSTPPDDEEHGGDVGGLAVEESKPQLKQPPMYKVILLNDDYTPMEFVIEVLRKFFRLDRERAVQVMLHVHTRGQGVCGTFTRDVAETKVAVVNEFSKENDHPLKCTMEQT